MSSVRRIALLALVAIASACTSKEEAAQQEAVLLKAREHRLAGLVARADSQRHPDAAVAMWIMPSELREISGIALATDGRLFAHDDEEGKVYVLDPRRGTILKSFTLGNGPKKDFEAITFAGPDIYMLVSDGVIYKFREGANNSRVQFTVIDTHLGKECEFEGIAYEPDSSWLVMPCKNVNKKDLRGNLVIYRLKLGAADSLSLSDLVVPMDNVVAPTKWKQFKPSDITIDPVTGNYVMVGSQEQGIVELTPDGEIVRAQQLPGKHHQAEGVAITRDGLLIVSDEATAKPAAVTLYRWRRNGTGEVAQ